MLYLRVAFAAVIGLAIAAETPTGGSLLAEEQAEKVESELPLVVDLTKFQTPFCTQGNRDACIYHPPIAALEAAYRRAGTSVSLSVEHLIWNRNVTSLADGTKITDPDLNENGLANLTGGSMLNGFDLLSKYAVCRTEDMAYRLDYDNVQAGYFQGFDVTDFKWWEPFRQISLNRFNLDPHQYPAELRRHARYGIKDYVVLSGEDCKNTRKIEEALAAGHEVGVNMFVQFKPDPGDATRNSIPRVVWYRAKHAQPVLVNSHAMLIVGYDRPRQFFVVKNSWGPNESGYEVDNLPPGWKDIARYKGFTLIHYNYLQGNREAAYITRVADPSGNDFHAQRALGFWDVKFQRQDTHEDVASGILAWRRLPGTQANPAKDLRIGDFYWAGKEFRVNARLEGTDPTSVTLYIDFDHPQMPYGEARGVKIKGILSLPEGEAGTIRASKLVAPDGVADLFDVPVGELRVTAVQSTNANPLLEIPTQNLLVNASFEKGPEVNTYQPMDKGSSDVKGWKVTRGQIDYLGSYMKAAEGVRSIDLHGSPGYGGIEQTFHTKPGTRYRVTFSMAGTPASVSGNGGVKRLAAGAAREKEVFSFDTTGKKAADLGWETKTWHFVADADKTTLEFYTVEQSDPNCGPLLDKIRVVAVPE
jgi:choice-of-anchor C domain-containing protein